MSSAALLFDLDDTLISYADSERTGLSAALNEHGLPSGPDVLEAYRSINSGLWRSYAAGEVSAEELRSRRFIRLLEHLGRPAEQAPMLAESYLLHFSNCGVPVSGARELLETLTERGHRLGVITNGFTRMQRPRLERSGLADYFDAVVISDEAGLTKPDPRIFRLALGAMGIDSPSSAFFIGDNPSDDIGGAARFGMRTIWFRRYRSERDCPEADYTVDDLARIPGLVTAAV